MRRYRNRKPRHPQEPRPSAIEMAFPEFDAMTVSELTTTLLDCDALQQSLGPEHPWSHALSQRLWHGLAALRGRA